MIFIIIIIEYHKLTASTSKQHVIIYVLVSDPRLRHRVRDILHFTFSDTVTRYHVSNATLFIYIRGVDRRTPIFIEIFKVVIADHAEHPALQRVIAKQVYPQSNRGDWMAVDFTETVSEWFKSSRSNFGFVVNATANGKKVAVTDVNVDKGKKVAIKVICKNSVKETKLIY